MNDVLGWVAFGLATAALMFSIGVLIHVKTVASERRKFHRMKSVAETLTNGKAAIPPEVFVNGAVLHRIASAVEAVVEAIDRLDQTGVASNYQLERIAKGVEDDSPLAGVAASLHIPAASPALGPLDGAP